MFQGRRVDHEGLASPTKVETSVTLADAWWDLTDIGNTWLNGDQYAAVIGQDPATYVAAIDVTIGTTTSVTP